MATHAIKTAWCLTAKGGAKWPIALGRSVPSYPRLEQGFPDGSLWLGRRINPAASCFHITPQKVDGRGSFLRSVVRFRRSFRGLRFRCGLATSLGALLTPHKTSSGPAKRLIKRQAAGGNPGYFVGNGNNVEAGRFKRK